MCILYLAWRWKNAPDHILEMNDHCFGKEHADKNEEELPYETPKNL